MLVKSGITSVVSLRGKVLVDYSEKLAHVIIDLYGSIAAKNENGELGRKTATEINSLDFIIPSESRCLKLAVCIMMNNTMSSASLAKFI